MKYCKELLNDKVLELMEGYEFRSPVIEVGCGQGQTLERICLKYDVTGIDLSARAIDCCKKKGLKAEKKDLFTVSDKFNSVVCIDVVEHVKNDEVFIAHLYRILNPGGKVFILVPSGKLMNDDLFFGHYRRYSLSLIRNLLEKVGFTVESAASFGYPLLYYTRQVINTIFKLPAGDDSDFYKQTLKSSYEHPFDGNFFIGLINQAYRLPLFLPIFKYVLFQNFSTHRDNGFSCIIIAQKPVSI